ncbi:hypothetical protein TNIN_21941 [Trichonephila inaurata madagascariensis]|uniref:Uncharacterized protein n=1 Tax=Trichonephila inaurata madagascariensis TaxID=2747483 RepID=A0A8X6YBW7_9ARAC|nr:hypothetical protein TNIN_21941 [Trichonephila inaurata madagascariensis]
MLPFDKQPSTSAAAPIPPSDNPLKSYSLLLLKLEARIRSSCHLCLFSSSDVVLFKDTCVPRLFISFPPTNGNKKRAPCHCPSPEKGGGLSPCLGKFQLRVWWGLCLQFGEACFLYCAHIIIDCNKGT